MMIDLHCTSMARAVNASTNACWRAYLNRSRSSSVTQIPYHFENTGDSRHYCDFNMGLSYGVLILIATSEGSEEPAQKCSLARACVASTHKAGHTVYCTDSNEPVHEISNNVVCATSKGSDQPAHSMRRLIRTFASRLNIL